MRNSDPPQQLIAHDSPARGPRPEQDAAPPRVRPFLKWAGGKRRLIPDIAAAFPADFNRYFEPFLGGGAVLFHVLSAYPDKDCSASDSNPELVSTYEAIRDGVERLVPLLQGHAERVASGGGDYYYAVRGESPQGADERAARMLFLNRTCFNGLYRLNSSGKFNVPFAGHHRQNIVNAAVLRAASSALSTGRLSIACRDFEEAVAGASAGDLVYMDPPYQPTSPTAGFTHYTREDFTVRDLMRLAGVCHELAGRGCRVLLSNSDTPEVRWLFRGEAWRYRRLAVNRMINADGANRRGHAELLIRNY